MQLLYFSCTFFLAYFALFLYILIHSCTLMDVCSLDLDLTIMSIESGDENDAGLANTEEQESAMYMSNYK